MFKQLVVLIFLVVVSSSTFGQNARTIIQQVLDRDDGKTQYSKQTIATCKYAIKSRRIKCTEKPRIKILETANKDYGKNGKDSKSVMIILDPPAERGIGFLQYDYDDKDKSSDQWMYLSALGKVKRIVSGSENEPKTGSLFGSEFGYEDTEKRHIDDATYSVIKEEKYQGRETWVIESTPTPQRARKSNYSKSQIWVDKERFVIMKSKLYDRRGKLVKQMTQSDFIQQDSVWIARKLNMNNVQSKRISTMKLSKISLNIPVDNKVLTQRVLTDDAFREKHLIDLRKNAF